MNPPYLWGHCVFCLRKVSTNPSFCKAVTAASGSNNDKLPVVPHTPPAFLTELMITAHLLWPFMRSSQGEGRTPWGDTEEPTFKQVMAESSPCSEMNVTSQTVTICQLCANEVVQVEQLMEAVRGKVRLLRRIISDSKKGGLHSWRMTNLEKGLKEAGLGEQEVASTVRYWDNLGDIGQNQRERQGNDAVTSAPPKKKSRRSKKEIPGDQEDGGNKVEGKAESGRKSEEGNPPLWVKDEFHSEVDEEVMPDPLEPTRDEEFNPDVDREDDGDSAIAPEFENEVVIPSDDKTRRATPECPESEEGGASLGKAVNGVLFTSSWEYLCPEPACGESFDTQRHLKSHQKQDHPEKYSDCVCHCGKVFRYPNRRKKHQTTCFKGGGRPKGDGSIQKCDMCGVLVSSPKIGDHIRGHVGDFAIPCPNPPCPFVFSNTEPIQLHLNSRCAFSPKMTKAPEATSSSSARRIKNETYLYKCDTCGFESFKRLVFRTHLYAIHERASHKNHGCPITGCDATFTVRQTIDFHLTTHKFRQTTSQKCDLCPDTVPVEQMKDHLTVTHEHSQIFSCPQCPFLFGTRVPFVEHQYLHRHLGFFCDICGSDVKFSKYFDLRRHYEGEHQVDFPRFPCEFCGKVVATKDTLRSHVRVHHSGRRDSSEDGPPPKRSAGPTTKYSCDLCFDPVPFSNLDSLLRHKIRLHGVEPYQCKSCGRPFTSPSLLASHEKAEHEGLQKECRCDVPGCGKVFSAERKLKHHLYKSHKTKQHVCSACPKSFSSPKLLQTHHDFVHLGIRAEICETCGEAFANRAVLRKHQLIHTGERPFQCPICSQRFRHNGVLRRHLQSHAEKGASFKPNGPMKQIRKRKAPN